MWGDTMAKNIFISWSGHTSHGIAKVLDEWLPQMIHSVNPFLSSKDIHTGSLWFSEISSELEHIHFGILCLTADNMNAPWILFEAGALFKGLGQTRVAPLLIRLAPTDVQGPLSHFNAASLNEEDLRKLLHAINIEMGENGIAENRLARSFEICWPGMKRDIDRALEGSDATASTKSVRPDRDILEEMLLLTRSIAHRFSALPTDRLIVQPLKMEAETWQRRFEMVRPSSEQQFLSGLWWMTECGTLADLELLQSLAASPPFDSQVVRDTMQAAIQQLRNKYGADTRGRGKG